MDPDAYLCQLADVFNGISVQTPSISAVVAIVLAGLLLLVSGFASASEIAFFSLSPSDLNAIAERKHPSDEKISNLLDNSERLLATILITNNFVNVTIIMLCNFFFMNVFQFHSPIAEFLILTVVLTFLLLLFGEIMPKIYSAQKTLAFCRFAAPGITFCRSVFYPMASMLVRSTSFLNKHMVRKNHNISVDELSHALELTDKAELSDEKISNLLDNSERLLATILITNNFVNVTIIMLCNFFFMNVFQFHSPIAEFLILTVVLTFLLLLFGEIMPKIYSAQKTLAFCRFAAPGITFCRSVFYPMASMLVRSTSFLNKHMVRKNHNISVDELSHALELTDKAELSEENNILEGIIRFGGETAKEVMTSRLDVVDLDIRTPFKDVVKCIVENVYSRIPIYADSRDNIKGVLYIKDLLPHLNKGDNFRWQSLIRPAYFVPETKMIDDLLRDFQANKIHIAIVVDEFGGTSGIVTMEDIIEEIVGEIHDEYDDEERTYAVLNDHTWVFEAKTQLTDFYKITKIDEETFDEVAGDADTLAGLLLELKGEFPALHEKVTYGRYEFEVLEMDNRRILKVKFTVNAPAEPNSSSL